MRKTTLVVMAAGIGSRFGGGIKQLEPVGPSGEIIMDYSVYDAMQAGFDKVVFIIRKDLEKDFREIIGNRMEKIVETAYAFQELDDLPAGFQRPEGRTKPWGTGQAILCCKDLVQEPFAVINADDYYGKEAFVKVHDYLAGEHPACGKMDFCMAGFQLGNTLSENGGVTRGICSVNEDGHLTKVTETKNIVKTPEGAAVVGIYSGNFRSAGKRICRVPEKSVGSDEGRVSDSDHRGRTDPETESECDGSGIPGQMVRRDL